MPTTPVSSRYDQREDDNAPWTIVSAKGNRRRDGHTVEAAINFHNPSVPPRACGAVAGPSGAAAADNATTAVAAHIELEHVRVSARWREQPSYLDLSTLVSTHVSGHTAVTRAVCLGSGSFGGPLDGGESIRRAHMQTEAFLVIVDLLGLYR